MKRSDLKVGAELAYVPSNEWATGSVYQVQKVTVADTRGFFARRAGYRNTERPDIVLQDGSTASGRYYVEDSSRSTCLVRHNGDLRLVSLAHLRGDYATCLAQVEANVRARQERNAQIQAHQEETQARIQSAAEALKSMGVNLGFVSSYATKLELNASQAEQIVSLLTRGA